jgi:hypothetical protein
LVCFIDIVEEKNDIAHLQAHKWLVFIHIGEKYCTFVGPQVVFSTHVGEKTKHDIAHL